MMVSHALSVLTPYDFGALALLGLAWLGIGWLIERQGKRPSVTVMMGEIRREWMRQLFARDNRIMDSSLIAVLRQSASFFASTTLLAVGGVLALIGNTSPLEQVAEGLESAPVPVLLWQIKLAVVAFLLAHAFLKFVWSNRLFGYCAVMIGAVPPPGMPGGEHKAEIAAMLQIRAALSFNAGLRSMYFALGALAWLLGAVALGLATLVVAWLLWAREFTSHAQAMLAKDR